MTDDEMISVSDSTEESADNPPALPPTLSQDERYLALLLNAIGKCKTYQPKFGQGKAAGWTLTEFTQAYAADPFYHWLGVDSSLMYAAHKAAGGMTSVYRQIGIGSQWVFFQMLQDCLGLSPEQAAWSYLTAATDGKSRKLSLDGRIDIDAIADLTAQARVKAWIYEAGMVIGLPAETLFSVKGVVFEARQGYKSKDSKRQNADIANATKAYANLYIPVILLFSTQIDGDVAHRYRQNLWLLLTGTVEGAATASAYSFCREVLDYHLAAFFQRHSPRIKAEVENVLRTLLNA